MLWFGGNEPNKMKAASNPSAKPKSSSEVGQNKLTLKQRVEIINAYGIDNRLISLAQITKQYGIRTTTKKRGYLDWNSLGINLETERKRNI